MDKFTRKVARKLNTAMDEVAGLPAQNGAFAALRTLAVELAEHTSDPFAFLEMAGVELEDEEVTDLAALVASEDDRSA